MKDKEHIEGLFTSAGCLTLETMKRHSASTLSQEDKIQVDEHLESCKLCSDALEGLLLVSNPEKIDSIVSEINENLRSKLPTEKPVRTIRLTNRMYYMAAAASVIIFIGVFSYFRFYMQDQNTQLSVVTEKTEDEKGSNFKTATDDMKAEDVVEEVEESVPSSPTKEEHKKIVATDKSQVDIQALEDDSDMELVIDNISIPEVDQRETTDIIEKTIIEQPSAAGSAEEPTEYVIGGVTITGDEMDDEQLSLEEETTGVIQPASNSLRMKPVSSKKGKGRSVADADNDYYFVDDTVPKEENQYFSIVEKNPEFPGGVHELYKYLRETINYPDSAKIAGIQGKVLVSFVVRETGKIDSVKVLRGIGGGCDEEALKVLKAMPDWIPGKQRNQPVNVQMVLPIEFKLDN